MVAPGRSSRPLPCACVEINQTRALKSFKGGEVMKIKEVMSKDVHVARPDETLREAAATMKKIDAGVLPVGDQDRLVGMLTDRDIAVRGVAECKGPDAKVRDVMSQEVRYCFDDEDV